MTDTEQPSQWALDLLADIIDIGGLGGPCSEADCAECGKMALRIQAAFAEREAELVGALAQWEDCALYDATMEGPVFKGWDRSALDRCRTAAIKSREAGHG